MDGAGGCRLRLLPDEVAADTPGEGTKGEEVVAAQAKFVDDRDEDAPVLLEPQLLRLKLAARSGAAATHERPHTDRSVPDGVVSQTHVLLDLTGIDCAPTNKHQSLAQPDAQASDQEPMVSAY